MNRLSLHGPVNYTNRNNKGIGDIYTYMYQNETQFQVNEVVCYRLTLTYSFLSTLISRMFIICAYETINIHTSPFIIITMSDKNRKVRGRA